MRKVMTAASMLFTTSIISVGAAIASPTSVTTSGQPAVSEAQTTVAPVNSVDQPSANTQTNKPDNIIKKAEVKSSIEAQSPASVTPAATRCTGDARSTTPPVVNNPHHVRNVVWRNMRAMCAN